MNQFYVFNIFRFKKLKSVATLSLSLRFLSRKGEKAKKEKSENGH